VNVSATDFSYLWDGTSEGWVLVKLDGGAGTTSYAIANRGTKRGLIIEDNATFTEVVTKMLGHGCPVVTPKELSGK
jgi:hypothetical protein